jgi:hypothetical protein
MSYAGLTKPTKPTDWSNQEKVQEYLDAKQDYNLAIQAIMQDRAEETTTRTNISKAEHDAMMAIAQNFQVKA